MVSSVSALLTSGQITSLIQQASAAFQAPAGVLQAQEQPIQTQISALGKVQSALSGLQSALAGLGNLQTLSQRSVATSPTGIVQATVTNEAAVGTYSLTGIHLAAAESLISSGSSSSSGSLGSGSIAIEVGSGSTATVNISSGSSSLAGIAAAIDQANTGVRASVLFDGSAYHLVLTGDATGSANAFTVTGSGALVGLSYHAGASGLAIAQVAANASFSLNGVTITSGSNAISGVIPGLTLTVAGSGSATVTVSQSTDALDSAAQSLVQALNSTLQTISQFSSFSSVSGAGPLLGNVGLQILRTDLLGAITTPAGGSGSPFTSLSAVGFTVTSGGTVTLDNATFQSAAQSNYAAVAALLGKAGVATNPNVTVQNAGSVPVGSYAVDVIANTGGTLTGTINGEAASGTGGLLIVNDGGSLQGLTLQISPGVTGALGDVTISQGLFGGLSSIVNAALTSGSGSVTGEITSLNSSIASMNQQIATLQQEARQETQALTAQFSVAQATLSQLSTVSNFLSTYFNLPSGGSGG
jgi:flagellar hook-associated protein 2